MPTLTIEGAMIRVKDVKKAYRDYKLFPISRGFFHYTLGVKLRICGACALGALYISKHFPKGLRRPLLTYANVQANGTARQWANETYGKEYAFGFIRGFDKRPLDAYKYQSERRREG